MALTKVPNELSSTPSIVDGGNATAITITSDEDLLVAKGSLDVATVGHELRASGYSAATRDGATVGSFTRLNSDGTILEFRKSSAAVGSIGTTGSNVVIGTGNTGLRFYDGGSAIIPHTAAGGSSNGLVDLGQGGFNAFKDLYLSGGAYLGGTAAANKLDLYETGTFTPVLKGSTATGSFTAGSGTTAKYVAIGDTVTISIALRNCTLSGASGDIYIDGCPFSLNSGVNYPIGGFMSHNLSFDTAHHQSFYGQSDNIFGMQSRTGTSWIGWPVTNSSGIYLHITMVCTKV